MKNIEYAEANNNFRYFVGLEKEYLQLFVNSMGLLIAGYWFVSQVPLLRLSICGCGLFLSCGVLITELRYATYFRHFFNVAVTIEQQFGASQFSDIKRYFSRPFLGVRSTNVIIAFYVVALSFWALLTASDVLSLEWFQNTLSQIAVSKSATK